MDWQYDKGVHRRKHQWKHDEPGFEPGRRGQVGKCPANITAEMAAAILNAGVPVFEGPDSEYPDRIYAYHAGAIYEAVPTVPGVSYHGYPWRGDLPGRTPPPRGVMERLAEQAESIGECREFKRWLKKYGG